MSAAITNFHFLRPEWLLALIPLAGIAWLMLRQRLRTGRWRDAVDPELAQWLMESGWQGTARAGLVAVLLAWVLGTLALAGPTWEKRPQPVSRGADALVVILDLSLSMYAEDIAPSRLVRARLKIADVLAERADGQTALVVFAGDAHVVVPLTDDTGTLTNLLPALEPNVMPVMGSRAQDAVRLATDLLDEAAADDGRILLLTDEITDAAAVVDATDRRYPVSVIGVGTEAGAPIPLRPLGRSGHLSTDAGTVIPTLEAGALRAVADATGGRYARFTTSDADLRSVLGWRPAVEADEGDDREREFDLWIDRGPWLVLLVLPVVLLAFRRGVVAVLALGFAGLLGAPVPVAANPLQDWFLTEDQKAYRALRRGETETAVNTFENPAWRATALYRNEDYADAAAVFPGEDADALYNRATALARAGEFEAAKRGYEAALERAPDHEDARHNLDVIERLLEEQKNDAENEQASQQQDPNQEDGSDSSASRRNEQGGSQDSDQRQRSSESGQGQEGSERELEQSEGQQSEPTDENGEPTEDESLMARRSREQEQALEQWLRRVPDEPGALLRRKFRYEADRRYRQGLRRAPEDQQPW